MTKPAKTPKLDTVGAEAVDAARAALLELVPEHDVGEHLGREAQADKVVTHFFDCTQRGYRGWRWSVTVARAPRQKVVTVDEVVLLPGPEAILAPEWLPWRERIRPGDLSPGDLLPSEEDDLRLAPAYTAADEEVDEAELKRVSDELGLGRPQVLSLDGRELAAERWYAGSHGPDTELARSAPASCASCGFLVKMAGPLGRLFGVCANAFANDDGRVVSFDHGCGAHSEARLGRRNLPQPLPEPALDTMRWEELETF
ncbi:MAG: FIG01121526: hypothetical protein [uncultured Nocardioidaceae bacterium]|uniref:DUF3027 domain-containing protein n=1 Tax=uncultured Nocardioidaceae bacterium TaxID=253824 RepID=A0A6J4MVD2_9ACTN|nr:MAG: FIG01121526: hypothetical protein [uncultured Nocardioidaceae bacterium]